jgi:cytochrome P450
VTTTTDLNPFTSEAIENPYPVHAALRERGPVYVEAIDAWVVSRFDDVTAVLQDPEGFSSRYVGSSAFSGDPELLAIYKEGWSKKGGITALDPPEHAWFRRVQAAPFSPRGIRGVADRIEQIVNELIDDFIDRGSCDLHRDFARPLPLPVFAEIIGYPLVDVPKIKDWSDEQIELLGGVVGAVPRARLLDLARSDIKYQRYMHELFEERRANPQGDLLSDLVQATLGGDDPRPLTDGELIATIFILLNGGNETTTNLIVNGIELLLRHPDQHQLLLDDPSLVPNFVEESLRFESAVQCLFRATTKEVSVGGVTIPARAKVAVLYGAANRDPERWDDPETFDVTRPDAKKSVSFGTGIHVCLGAHLARLEGCIAFEVLLRRLPNLRFAPGRNDFRHAPSVIVRGFNSLWIEWDKP